jgi:hypothetical protein
MVVMPSNGVHDFGLWSLKLEHSHATHPSIDLNLEPGHELLETL